MRQTGELRCVVVGGGGALGRNLVCKLRSLNCAVVSVDRVANKAATHNYIVSGTDPMSLQALTDEIKSNGPFEGVFCVAGGWTGGRVVADDFIATVADMWERNVVGAAIAASIAGALTSERPGLVVFTSAKASLGATGGMVAYGMAKASINHLVKSLADQASGLPENSQVVAVLPEMLDTEANRQTAPQANRAGWTQLDTVSGQFATWLVDACSRPPSGSLVTIVTRDNQTAFTVVS